MNLSFDHRECFVGCIRPGIFFFFRAEADHTFAILKPGRHEIELRDEVNGLSAKTFVIVQEE